MPRISDMVRDAHFSNDLMTDDGEVLDAIDQADDSGSPCRIRTRGTEAGLDVGGFTTNPKTDEYVIGIRVSEIPALTESHLIRNKTQGLRYRIIEPPTLSDRDRGLWLAVCRLVS